MQLERRALYNLVRMNWLNDRTLTVAEWQVQNYRAIPTETLLKELERFNIMLTEEHFILLANKYDSPEDLVECLLEEYMEVPKQDHIYLIVFELWRRLIPEKASLSIFCDELDLQINLYDQDSLENHDGLEDLISNLQAILDENVDQGEEPPIVFKLLLKQCANDIETFLYDIISEQIENENHSYASELIEGFYPYISDKVWFEFLRAQVAHKYKPSDGLEIIHDILKNYSHVPLDLLLENLAFLSQHGSYKNFQDAAKKIVSVIDNEEQFYEFVDICADFYSYMEMDDKEKKVIELKEQRLKKSFHNNFNSKSDPDVKTILKFF